MANPLWGGYCPYNTSVSSVKRPLLSIHLWHWIWTSSLSQLLIFWGELESSTYNNAYQSNNPPPYTSERDWTQTVSIQLGKAFEPPPAQLAGLNNIVVTPEGERRLLRGWRPIVWWIDAGWCNRAKWVKAFTHIHCHTRFLLIAHPPSSPGRVFFMHSKRPAVTSLWQPLLTVTPLWVQKRFSTQCLLWRAFLRENTHYSAIKLRLIDWHSQTFRRERRHRRLWHRCI